MSPGYMILQEHSPHGPPSLCHHAVIDITWPENGSLSLKFRVKENAVGPLVLCPLPKIHDMVCGMWTVSPCSPGITLPPFSIVPKMAFSIFPCA